VAVWRPAGKGDWLDRPEAVFASGTGQEPAKALEVGVVLGAVGLASRVGM
jgi:hypothetical protein